MLTKCFHFLLFFLTATLALHAEAPGAALKDPDVIAKTIAALSRAKIPGLTSHAPTDAEPNSYHLKAINYCGYLTRFGKRYYIVTVHFIRSSKLNSEYPPARGHGFILILDSDFHIVSHARCDYFGGYLEDDKLMDGDQEIIDFTKKGATTRHFGWLVDNATLPYPFDDKITDEEWESGSFKKKAR